MEIATAAVKMAQEAMGAEVEDEQDIPEVPVYPERGARAHGGERPFRKGDRDSGPKRGAPGGRRGLEGGSTRLYIGAGREAGVRPGDLVGAITGEAGVSGREIGAIEITDRFSIVEVADEVAERVLDSLRATKIKGKKVTVRRDKGQ